MLPTALFTTKRMTGNMDAVDWNSCAKEWSHLKGLPFPKMGPRPIMDIFIGLDCADLLAEIFEARQDSQLQGLHHWDGHVLVPCTTYLSPDCQSILLEPTPLQIR